MLYQLNSLDIDITLTFFILKEEIFMHIEISKSKLVEGLSNVAKFTGKDKKEPILESILIVAEKDKLRFIATNSKETIERSVLCDEEVSIISEGTVLVEKKIVDVAKKLTKEPIKLKLPKNTLQVTSEKSKFTLNTFKVNDYPVIKPSQAEYFADIECSILEEAINSVCYAASTSNQRPILKGIHLTVSENLMILQSTDSHQLAYKAIKLQNTFKQEIKMTIPAITLKEAINSFDTKKSIKLSKLNNTFILSSDTETFRTQTLEGEYPDVLVRLLSPLHENVILVNKRDILEALEQIMLFTSNKPTGIFTLNNNAITIENEEKSEGNAQILFPTEDITTPDPSVKPEDAAIKFGFNVQLLYTSIKVINCDSISIGFNSEKKPISIVHEDYYNNFGVNSSEPLQPSNYTDFRFILPSIIN